jgi:hypothetical protein
VDVKDGPERLGNGAVNINVIGDDCLLITHSFSLVVAVTVICQVIALRTGATIFPHSLYMLHRSFICDEKGEG